MKRPYSNAILCVAVFAALTAGCIPIPHTDARSARVTGRVVDAITLAPINRAKVELKDAPHHAIYTDEKGQFDLEPTRNQYWCYLIGGAEWPRPKSSVVVVSHIGYYTTNVTGEVAGEKEAGDVKLSPRNAANQEQK